MRGLLSKRLLVMKSIGILDSPMDPIKKFIIKARHSFFIFGLASILWFIFRTGSKPTRMIYPCQQASVASGGLWLAAYVLPLFMAVRSAGGATRDKGRILAGFLLLLIISLFVTGGSGGPFTMNPKQPQSLLFATALSLWLNYTAP